MDIWEDQSLGTWLSNRTTPGLGIGGTGLGVPGRESERGDAPHGSAALLSFRISIPPTSFVQTRTSCLSHATSSMFLSLERVPFSLLPNSFLCKALFWITSTPPHSSLPTITLSRCSAPHLPWSPPTSPCSPFGCALAIRSFHLLSHVPLHSDAPFPADPFSSGLGLEESRGIYPGVSRAAAGGGRP